MKGLDQKMVVVIINIITAGLITDYSGVNTVQIFASFGPTAA